MKGCSSRLACMCPFTSRTQGRRGPKVPSLLRRIVHTDEGSVHFCTLVSWPPESKLPALSLIARKRLPGGQTREFESETGLGR
jgi:hypothetical protein